MPSKKVPTKPLETQQYLKEVQRLGPLVDQLRDRLRQVERLCRVMGDVWALEHLNHSHLSNGARRRNHFDNALREIKRNLKAHGNEFDQKPYIDNTE